MRERAVALRGGCSYTTLLDICLACVLLVYLLLHPSPSGEQRNGLAMPTFMPPKAKHLCVLQEEVLCFSSSVCRNKCESSIGLGFV